LGSEGQSASVGRSRAPACRTCSPSSRLDTSPPDAMILGRSRSMKILAIQFRYLGDAALLTPALRAVRSTSRAASSTCWSQRKPCRCCNICLGWRGLGLPGGAERRSPPSHGRSSGRSAANASTALLTSAGTTAAPLSAWFVAPASAWSLVPGGFLGRRLCYTHTRPLQQGGHQSLTNFQLLAAWGIAPPDCPRLEICPDPALARVAEQMLPRPAILCTWQPASPKKNGRWRIGPSFIAAPPLPGIKSYSLPASPRASRRCWRN